MGFTRDFLDFRKSRHQQAFEPSLDPSNAVKPVSVPPSHAPAETGYQNTPWQTYGGWLANLDKISELRWPYSVGTFRRMSTDAQITQVVSALALPILSTGWHVDPAGADPNVTQFICDNLGLPLVDEQNPKPPLRERDRFNFLEHLRLAFTEEVTFGHAFFEQVYRIENGKAWLHKLAFRPPETISKIDVSDKGSLVAIEQFGIIAGQVPRITVDRLVAHIHDRRGGEWDGKSILEPAYKYYKLKEELLAVLAISDKRNGLGIPVYTAMKTDPVDDKELYEKVLQQVEQELGTAKKLVEQIKAGDEAGAAIPPTATLDFKGVTGRLPDLLSHIKYFDDMISKSALMHFLNLGQDKGTGSWALGETFADFFVTNLQAKASQLRDVINQHVVEDLVDLNFGPAVAAPRVGFDEIGSKHPITAEAIFQLVQCGAILPEPALERRLRKLWTIPPKDPYTPPAVPKTPKNKKGAVNA